ncbi:DNA translocase FtsK [Lysinibacillus sp. LZ02]|uniref:DNA translocase FtsK n=1 Tax=Lysinibacillus sp. LZ02 TaxID=3420668 RepID=UPI003D36E330
MNWFKNKFNKLFKDDIEQVEEYEEYYEEQDEPYFEEEQQKKSKSAFRFPLIADNEIVHQAPKQERVAREQQPYTSSEERELELPKHLQHATSQIYDVEIQGIRGLLERRQKRTGHSNVLRRPVTAPRKISVTKDEKEFLTKKPMREEKPVNREFTNPLESRKRFVPTDVPSPVHGFQKPKPIEQLMAEKQMEMDEAKQDKVENVLSEQMSFVEGEAHKEVEMHTTESSVSRQSIEAFEPVVAEEVDCMIESASISHEENDSDMIAKEMEETIVAEEHEDPLSDMQVKHLTIENSTIHIGQLNVEQAQQNEFVQVQTEETKTISTGSRLPFNVLMLKSDKEKLLAKKILQEQLQKKKSANMEMNQEAMAESVATTETDIVIKNHTLTVVEPSISHEVVTSTQLSDSMVAVLEREVENNEIQHTVELSEQNDSMIEEHNLVPEQKPSNEQNVVPPVQNELVMEQNNVVSEQNVVPPAQNESVMDGNNVLFEQKVIASEQNPSNEQNIAQTVQNELVMDQNNVVSEQNVIPPAQNESVMDENNVLSEQKMIASEQKPSNEQNVIPPVQNELVMDQSNVLSEQNEIKLEIESQPKFSRHYEKPPLNFLVPPEEKTEDWAWMDEQGERLIKALSYFHIEAEIVSIVQGPAVTQFEITVAHGTKVSKVRGLADDIKLALAARDIRIDAPIPGKHSIGIEIPNRVSRAVRLSEVTNSEGFQTSDSPLEAALGLDLTGQPVTIDLRKMPHGLIAGATGSGKSVCINSILVSLLYKAAPHELKLMLIDPKMVELAPFNHIPHLVSPVITDVKAATAALKWAVEEMERRYQLFMHAGVRDLTRFNQQAEKAGQHAQKLPYILIVIDELADLMMMSPADVEEAICRIAQKARACGIHLIVATQRPSVDVITGLIKSNIPTRIAFAVSSAVDSRTILDMQGAERLLGRGDMLYLGNGMPAPVRLQGTFVTDDEIEEIITYVRTQGEPEYFFQHDELLKKAEVTDEQDELFEEVCRYVFEQGTASTSSIQRRYKIGYNRAARLVDMLERHGFVSEQRGSKPREVFITESDIISMFQ